MHPELFGIVPAYALCLVAGDLVGVAVATVGAARAGLHARRFVLALAVLTAAALIGAKLYGLIESGGRVGPLSIEAWSGYRYAGGVLGVAIGLAVLGRWGRIPIGKLADVIAPAFGFAMSVTRVGCLLAGCCAGKPSDGIWAIRFPAHTLVWGAQVRAGLIDADAATSLPVHPLQIYFGALALAAGIFALWFERRKAYDGQVFLAYVTLYGSGQFLLEFLRFGPLPHVQYMALVLALVAAAVLAVKASAPVPQRSMA